jgi:hypothetical protein
MSFHPASRTLRSGLHPKSSRGANDSAYNVRGAGVAPRSAGPRSTPSASKPPAPSRRAAVGATSTRRDGLVDRAGANARPGHDERHVQCRVVDEEAVGELAMLAEGLAVVGGDHDNRRVCLVPEPLQHPADLPVRFRHLIVVARGGGAAIAWRDVRSVRLEQVHPEKEAPPAMLIQPRQRPGDHLASLALAGQPPGHPRHPIVVHLEAARQPEPAIQREGGHERPGREARPCQRFGQQRNGSCTRMPLCRASCPAGYLPVRMEACDGSVIGAGAKARVNRVPRAASASMAGVLARA